jgi:hypothetical protein
VTELAQPGLALECTGAAVHYEHDNGGVLLNSPMDEMPTYRQVTAVEPIRPRGPARSGGIGHGIDPDCGAVGAIRNR